MPAKISKSAIASHTVPMSSAAAAGIAAEFTPFRFAVIMKASE
jgi:hypothetical protein